MLQPILLTQLLIGCASQEIIYESPLIDSQPAAILSHGLLRKIAARTWPHHTSVLPFPSRHDAPATQLRSTEWLNSALQRGLTAADRKTELGHAARDGSADHLPTPFEACRVVLDKDDASG
jgi:hypothetical protein